MAGMSGGRLVRHRYESVWPALRRTLVSSLLLVGLSGCVSFNYANDPIEQLLLSGQTGQALAALESRSQSARDETLYYLDKGMLLRLEHEFQASNEAFEQAKRINEQLEAVSVREQVGAMSVNDTLRSYLSPPFERAMLQIYKALNYLEMGDSDNARVEIMQLTLLNKNFDADERLPLSHYFAGLVFDSRGEFSDALIEYRRAFQRYEKLGLKIPAHLQADLLRLTEAEGLPDEHREFLQRFKGRSWARQSDYLAQGELVFFLNHGLIPHKQQQSITVQDPGNGQIHRISTPFYEQRRAAVRYGEIDSAGQVQRTELAERLDVDAEQALEAQMPTIIARAIARVSVKNRLVDNARDANPLLGAIVNIAGVVSEQADTRGWYTLPQAISIGRLNLAPGRYDIKVDYVGSGGRVIATDTFTNVLIRAGQKTFLSAYQPASHVINRRPRR